VSRDPPKHNFPLVSTIGLRDNVTCMPAAVYWKFYIFALSPTALETSWIFHDIRVRYPHIYRFATEIVDIRFIWLQLWKMEFKNIATLFADIHSTPEHWHGQRIWWILRFHRIIQRYLGAMQICIAHISYGNVSGWVAWLSVTAGIVSKRLNLS